MRRLFIYKKNVGCFSDYKHTFPGEIKTVRDLSIAYGAICDVMRYLDDGHGLLLLFIIGSFFLQLIITPYYLINAICQ